MMDVVSGEVNNDKGIKPPREKVEDTLQEIWREQHHYKPQPKKKHAAEKDTIRLLESQLPTPGAGEGVRTTVTVARRALLRVWQDKHAILADWLQVYIVGMIIALLFGELEPDSATEFEAHQANLARQGKVATSTGFPEGSWGPYVPFYHPKTGAPFHARDTFDAPALGYRYDALPPTPRVAKPSLIR